MITSSWMRHVGYLLLSWIAGVFALSSCLFLLGFSGRALFWFTLYFVAPFTGAGLLATGVPIALFVSAEWIAVVDAAPSLVFGLLVGFVGLVPALWIYSSLVMFGRGGFSVTNLTHFAPDAMLFGCVATSAYCWLIRRNHKRKQTSSTVA